ncbi:MAG: hypothetical protein JNM89_11840 [Hyphomicrobiaceae bacterium]|nr:hypothetical protein [Hyphomicrobiaceae bacterium]
MNYVLAIIAGLIGAVLGWVAAAALAIGVGSMLGASNFEGALGMQAVFGIGPIGGVIGLVVGIWLALRKGGQTHTGAIAWRFPIVIAAIACIVAGAFWYFYETRPLLASSGNAAPRLDFEIRLPPGVDFAAPAEAIRVELSTEQNRMPGTIRDKSARKDGDRTVATGSVELAYRSGWRLLELKTEPGQPARIFDLKLPARPRHMKDFGPWRRVDLLAQGNQQPQPAGPAEAYELRSRVVYPEAEYAEESRQKSH